MCSDLVQGEVWASGKEPYPSGSVHVVHAQGLVLIPGIPNLKGIWQQVMGNTLCLQAWRQLALSSENQKLTALWIATVLHYHHSASH